MGDSHSHTNRSGPQGQQVSSSDPTRNPHPTSRAGHRSSPSLSLSATSLSTTMPVVGSGVGSQILGADSTNMPVVRPSTLVGFGSRTVGNNR